MKPTIKQSAALAALVLGLATAGAAQADEAWLKSAGLGPHAPAQQDWAAIEKAARAEGKVVIYSVSSRIAKLADKFKEKYGVEVEGYDIPSDLQLEKFRREHKAGVHSVDVLFNAEVSLLLNEALPNKLVWTLVPDGVAPDLDAAEMEPFLVQRHSSRVVYYNTALNPDGPPIDTLWDLTREDWKGRVLLPSPLENSLTANFIQTILHHPDEMAEAYRKEFGEEIAYSESVLEAVKDSAAVEAPNASLEWLHRFLKNEPVFQGSTTKIFTNVADVKQDRAPLGITTFSKMRKNKAGVYAAEPIYGLEPAFGVSYPTILAIADMAPHPNAAKLLVRYMMEEGFKPWNEPGDYAARASVEAQQIKDFGIPPFSELKLWAIDPDEIYNSKYGFLTLYLTLG
jgi:iron(III) transport system substrate-binding protein